MSVVFQSAIEFNLMVKHSAFWQPAGGRVYPPVYNHDIVYLVCMGRPQFEANHEIASLHSKNINSQPFIEKNV